jgi:hypothetical protein
MVIDMTPNYARQLRARLMNAPVAPGGELAAAINVGTDRLLDVLEEQYFARELAEGISCFKYLEGDYGSGKSQLIQCLAQRAHAQNIVTSLVTIGQECPFSSPLAILRNVTASFRPPPTPDDPSGQRKGIELLLQTWIRSRLREMGVTPGGVVPDAVRYQIELPFRTPWLGAPDAQMGSGLRALGNRLTALESGAESTASDSELVAWVRGDRITSRTLKDTFGLHEAANDQNAFQRLKTVIAFLRERLHFKGFFVAFDEGTRITSFRRGSVKQRQAIENMLSMINQNAEGEFGGVMFLYAATPEFRSDVIQNTYTALRDRIGSVAFLPGRPMTPLIKLDDLNSDETLHDLGLRLLDVFACADGSSWDRPLQKANMGALIETEKRLLGFPSTVPPRYFVFHWCRWLAEQGHGQLALDRTSASAFVEKNVLPEHGDY